MRNGWLQGLGIALLAFLFAWPSGGIDSRARETSLAMPVDRQVPQDLNPIPGADFDGDMKPDVIVGTAAGSGYVLQIQFSTRLPAALLSFEGAGPGMKILSRDVNQDSDEDLIVTSCTSLIPIAVFLGDGKGHFLPDNPWNHVPSGLNSPRHYDSPAGHESNASNTEDRRFPGHALSTSFRLLRPAMQLVSSFGSEVSTDPITGSVPTLRGPPAALSL